MRSVRWGCGRKARRVVRRVILVTPFGICGIRETAARRLRLFETLLMRFACENNLESSAFCRGELGEYRQVAADGFGLALILFAGVRERILIARVPRPLQDTSIALVTAGILSLCFLAFKGMV